MMAGKEKITYREMKTVVSIIYVKNFEHLGD